MKHEIYLLKKILVVCLSFVLVVGCTEEFDDAATSPSVAPSPVEDVPVGQVEGSGFWINVINTQYDVLVNSATGSGAIGNNCIIELDSDGNAPAPTQMTCYIDMMEGDLYMFDVELQYNAPPNLCDHVRVTPPWHWNYSVGVGPSAVTVDIDDTGEDPIVTACTATAADSSVGNCNAHPELFDTANTAGPSCVYNNQGADGNVNCCYGDYNLTKNVTGDTGVETTVVPTNWGQTNGRPCLGGPVQTSWSLFSSNQFPVSQIEAVETDNNDETVGLNNSISLQANASGLQVGFSVHANFYETIGTPHSHDGYETGTTSDKPYAVEPIDDLDGSLIASGEDAYVFTCLDHAFEVKHQIRAYLREWNTLADFVAYQTSNGDTYNPDVTGDEGTNCDYDGVFGELCNDLSDFGDVLTDAGGSYPTISPASPTDHTTRATYFPRIEY